MTSSLLDCLLVNICIVEKPQSLSPYVHENFAGKVSKKNAALTFVCLREITG